MGKHRFNYYIPKHSAAGKAIRAARAAERALLQRRIEHEILGGRK